MIAEIIFFVALAVFIILLGRKTSIFQNLWGNLTSKATSLRPQIKFSKPRRAAKQVDLSGDDAHEFWGEEHPTAKQDLPSGYEEADALAKAGKFQQAEQILIKAASKNPTDSKIYARLGLMYLQQKNFSDAIESLKVAVKLERYNPSRHYNLALSYWGNKDVQRAIMSAREAISLDPVTQKYRQLLEQLLNGK